MDNYSFKHNSIVVYSIILTVIFCILVWFWVFGEPILAILNGEPMAENTKSTLVVLSMFWFGLLTFILWVLFSETSVIFTDDFVKKRLFLRDSKLMWKDITVTARFGFRVILKSARKKMEINLLYFADPEEIVRFIQTHTQAQ
jgi:hypothetical protein